MGHQTRHISWAFISSFLFNEHVGFFSIVFKFISLSHFLTPTISSFTPIHSPILSFILTLPFHPSFSLSDDPSPSPFVLSGAPLKIKNSKSPKNKSSQTRKPKFLKKLSKSLTLKIQNYLLVCIMGSVLQLLLMFLYLRLAPTQNNKRLPATHMKIGCCSC